jgi:hypothetical protein
MACCSADLSSGYYYELSNLDGFSTAKVLKPSEAKLLITETLSGCTIAMACDGMQPVLLHLEPHDDNAGLAGGFTSSAASIEHNHRHRALYKGSRIHVIYGPSVYYNQLQTNSQDGSYGYSTYPYAKMNELGNGYFGVTVLATLRPVTPEQDGIGPRILDVFIQTNHPMNYKLRKNTCTEDMPIHLSQPRTLADYIKRTLTGHYYRRYKYMPVSVQHHSYVCGGRSRHACWALPACAPLPYYCWISQDMQCIHTIYM